MAKNDPLQEPLNGFLAISKPQMLADYHDQISKEIDETFEFAEASSFPDATALYRENLHEFIEIKFSVN